MEDYRHTFNVIFNMPLSNPEAYGYGKTEYGRMYNVTTFHVKPIYWTTVIVEGTGQMSGVIDYLLIPRDILTASLVFMGTTNVMAIPKMVYSACAIFSGCTVFSASPTAYTASGWSVF